MIGTIILALLYFGSLIWAIVRMIKFSLLFKTERNPFIRTCKRCGAVQNMYSWNVEGMEHISWWEEMYANDEDPNCPCHSYAKYPTLW